MNKQCIQFKASARKLKDVFIFAALYVAGMTVGYNAMFLSGQDSKPASQEVVALRQPGVTVWQTGEAVQVEYKTNGKWHRLDGPALYARNSKSAVMVIEQYWIDGQLSRLDGPAMITRNAQTGKRESELYFQSGALHRTDGPAVVYYQAGTEEIVAQESWINGVRVDVLAPLRPSATMDIR